MVNNQLLLKFVTSVVQSKKLVKVPGVITPFVGTISIMEMMTSTFHNHSLSNLCFMIDIL